MIRFWRSCQIVFCFILFGLGAAVISFIIFPYISLTKPKEKQKKYYAEVIHTA